MINEQELEEYTKKIRERLIKRISDLQEKIITNEELPEGAQDLDLLLDIDASIEDCLSHWCY